MREYNETINYIETTEPDKVAEYIDNLEQQLAEKDREIKELKTQFDLYRSMSIQKDWNDPELIKSIRQQVCDEWWNKCCQIIEKNEVLDIQDIKKIKYQIEKGE